MDFQKIQKEARTILEFSENGPILTVEFYRNFFIFSVKFRVNYKNGSKLSKCVRTGIFLLLLPTTSITAKHALGVWILGVSDQSP